MSDFLTRLAERAQGLAPLAQPWLAPRFAAGPDLGSAPGQGGDRAAEPAPQPVRPLPRPIPAAPRPTALPPAHQEDPRAPEPDAAPSPDPIPA